MLHHSNMTAGPSSPIVPLMYVSSVELPPMRPDEDGTKGGKVQASIPPMCPDEDPTGGCAWQASVPPQRPDDDPQPITELMPIFPPEDGGAGVEQHAYAEQALLPPMRPEDDPIGSGSRQAVLPEDSGMGGEQQKFARIDPSIAQQALMHLERCREMVAREAIDQGLDPDDTLQDCFLFLATHLLPSSQGQRVRNIGGFVRSALRFQIRVRRVGAIQDRNFRQTEGKGPWETSLDVPLSDDGLMYADVLPAPSPVPADEEREQAREDVLYARLRRLPLRWQQEIREHWLLRGFVPHTNKRSRRPWRGQETPNAQSNLRARAMRELRRDQGLREALGV